MKEAIKTIVLIVLVGTSLFQSWLLAYRVPAFDTVEPTNYIMPQTLGKEKTIDQLVNPYRVVFHHEDGSNRVVMPTMSHYLMTVQSVKNRSFTIYREVDLETFPWSTLYENSASMELHFESEIPIQTLTKWMGINRVPSDVSSFNRLWIYYDDIREDVQTLFISEKDQKAWMASSDYPMEDLQRYLTISKYLPTYTFIQTGLRASKIASGYYLPDEPVAVEQLRLFYQPFTGEQMKSILFVDPSIIRQISERDGSVIYTDGNRGLQIRSDQRWMTYNAPVPPSEKETEESEDRLLTAIQFVNQHGGWNGSYLVAQTPLSELGAQTYSFRQYYGPYPIYEKDTQELSFVEVQLVNGLVSTYSRSMLTMDKEIERKKGWTGSKAEILSTLDSHGISPVEIQNMRLAYQTRISNEYVDLVPVWVIDTYMPNPILIPAMLRE